MLNGIGVPALPRQLLAQTTEAFPVVSREQTRSGNCFMTIVNKIKFYDQSDNLIAEYSLSLGLGASKSWFGNLSGIVLGKGVYGNLRFESMREALEFTHIMAWRICNGIVTRIETQATRIVDNAAEDALAKKEV